ncbi:MAG TPA: efflux RND transporter permease subunit [Planctomycetota bacterium]|nr:efflux RND transporter permease subunit [Planctomycetota bacterium]
MSLASTSIRHPVFAWMLMIGFIVFGLIGFRRLPVGLYPDVDYPVITLNATLQGASPEQMESDVVDPLEDAVMAVEGIRNVNSTCKLGSANVTVEFDISKDIEVALQDIQARVAQATKVLPKDLDPVIISKTNPEDQPIMWVAASGTRSQQEISMYAKNVLRDRFLTVDGTGDVSMGGYLERNMRIWLRNDDMIARGVTASEVIAAIQREHVETPSGRLEGSLREANVHFEGEALTAEQMGNILVATRSGQPVYVKNVALVEDGFEDKRRTARSNGLPAQGMGIIKQHGANTVEVADAARARVAELQKTLPKGMRLDVRVDQSKYIKDSIGEIEFTLILAVLLTALVCWLFLGSISSTLNVILAIPVSIFGTFAVMYFAGFSMNTFTLLALSLSVGIVVDDAVMVLENIYRHAEMGKKAVRASREGAEQITPAALAATMAIIAIFLPVAFMTGVIGKFFFQFGVVLSVAVAISLLEALTLAPARCSQFLRVGERGNIIERTAHTVFTALARAYAWVLGGILRFKIGFIPLGPLLVLVLAFSGFFGSLKLLDKLPKEMVPPQDQGFYMLRVTTPVGSTVDYTDKVMKEIETVLDKHPEIETTLIIAGAGEVNQGIGFITLKDDSQRKITQAQSLAAVRKETQDKFPGSRVLLVDPSQSGFASANRGGGLVAFSIHGPSWETLGELSEQFTEKMKNAGSMTDFDTDYRKGMPEVQVTPNREKALAQNVDLAQIAGTISALIGGQKIARFQDNGKRYDVRVRLMKNERSRPEDISNLYVRSRDGRMLQLSEVVDVRTLPSLQQITHLNRERAVTLSANPAAGHSQDEAIQEVERLAKELPEGYRIELTGSSQAFRESIDSLLFALVLGLICAYMVLASQFNSFLHPFTILLALPFSVSGALAALYFAGLSLNVYSMIGLILLMGIVKKNSILLVDYTNQIREQGKNTVDSLVEACPVRLRPILMTSVATIAAAIPGAISLGPGGELRMPMSVAVIGGLIVSTILTLIVVPSFYLVVDQIRTKLVGPPKTRAQMDADLAGIDDSPWVDPTLATTSHPVPAGAHEVSTAPTAAPPQSPEPEPERERSTASVAGDN